MSTKNRKRYTQDLISETLQMAGDQPGGAESYPENSGENETHIMSNILLAEAITNKIETGKPWMDKLRYLDEFEILKAVFKYVNVPLLKTCRLVSKVWNVEACTALRSSSYIRLFENLPKEMESFRRLLYDINRLGTPSPFERYHFSSSQLRSENMDLILLDDKSYVENLYIHESPLSYKCDFQRHMYQILMKDAPHLRVFHCALADGIGFSLVNAHSRLKLYLPVLAEFGYWEKDFIPTKPGCLNFIIEVIHGSPNLRSFHPKILNEKTFAQILRRTDLGGLENFHIQSIDSGHLQYLLKYRMPQLKVFSMQINRRSEKENKVSSELLYQLVENSSDTLEEMSITWVSNTPDRAFPKCPKLKNLTIDDWMGSLGIFDSCTLPELKKIHKIYYKEFPYEFILAPHLGVEVFTLEDHIQRNKYSPQMDFLQSVEEEYTYFFEYIVCQYPNLQCLDITLPISNALMTSILRLFPGLKTLAVENTHTCFSLSEHVFTGYNKHTLERHLELYGEITEMEMLHPRITPCFLEMTELQSLVLSRYSREGYPTHMMLTNNAIKYGIARMKKLEFLQINWV